MMLHSFVPAFCVQLLNTNHYTAGSRNQKTPAKMLNAKGSTDLKYTRPRQELFALRVIEVQGLETTSSEYFPFQASPK